MIYSIEFFFGFFIFYSCSFKNLVENSPMTDFSRKPFLVAFIAVSLLLSGCMGTGVGTDDPQVRRPPEELYADAQTAMEGKEYLKAGRLFDEVERQHPYSEFATKAQLMAARAAYNDLRYDEAVIALDRFIELHPGNEDVDYAFYLRALCYYEQITDVRRDQAMTGMALEALDALLKRYPNSKYARDAALKRDLTLDHLAGKEMEIGRYYLTRGHINAAINRFQYVIKEYQTTTHVPEALHRLVEAYMILGIEQEAMRVAAVLGHNFPGSQWYKDSYALLHPDQRQVLLEGRSWLDKTVDSILKPE